MLTLLCMYGFLLYLVEVPKRPLLVLLLHKQTGESSSIDYETNKLLIIVNKVTQFISSRKLR